MRIAEWNIKGEASYGWNNNFIIERDVVNSIISCETDIFILTAFVLAKGTDYLFEKLEEKGYIWFYGCESGENGIFIGIKKKIVYDLKSFTQKIYKDKPIMYSNENCNVLKIVFPFSKNQNISVIGCRMKTGTIKPLKKQYDSERVAFIKELLPVAIQDEEICVVGGDFNNARCLGDLNLPFDRNKYVGKAQENYNINYIKDMFEIHQFVMADNVNGKPVPTHKGYYPDDHVFLRGFSKVNFINTISAGGLSDHDMMVVEGIL